MAGQAFDDGGFHEPAPFTSLKCSYVRGMGRSYAVSSYDVAYEWLVRQSRKIQINGWQFLVAAALLAAVGTATPLPIMPAFPIAMAVLALAAFLRKSLFVGVATIALASLSWLYMADTVQRLSSYR